MEQKINYGILLDRELEKIKKETRHYAKRQLTWFRKNKETIWIDGENDVTQNIALIVTS